MTNEKEKIEIENENIKQDMNNLSPVIIDKYLEIVVKTRIGQRYFCDKLIKLYNCKCLLCDIDKKNYYSLAISNHDKGEAIDIHIGLLLYQLHDKLFDKGYITFNQDGKISIS